MVEQTNDAGSGQVNIIVPNPSVERGHRAPLQYSADGKYLVYGCRNNLVFKSQEEGLKDFVYEEHKNKICSVKPTPDGKQYAFGDNTGAVVIFEHAAGADKIKVQRQHMMLGGDVNDIEWVQWSREAKAKIVALGDGKSGQQARCYQAKGGMANGEIIGSSKLLLCSAVNAPEDADSKVKLWYSNEDGEIYCHTGTPFKVDTGKQIEKFGVFINSMDFSAEANAVVVVTGDKKIIIYDAESDEKLSTKEAAHGKGIYEVKWTGA
jgi:WD40 repeat protein